MSESPAKASLTDLRQFRLQKAKIASRNQNGTSAQKSEDNSFLPAPGRKRIQMLADSDSESDVTNSPKKTKIEISVAEKEQRFTAASKIAVEYDGMDIQDALVRSSWDVSAAIRLLKTDFKKKKSLQLARNGVVRNGSTTAHLSKERSKHSKHKHKKHSDDSDDDDDVKKPRDQVYDSEESDTETNDCMNPQRRKVFDFINKATINELQGIKTCSEKKAGLIIELRPFADWVDLRDKLDKHKSLSTDILNYCQELINKQNNVATIMAKCNKMVKNLEAAIATGAGITEQPSILNKEFKLAEYQMIGLNWLTVMFNQKMNAILADEMGLGKTIQVIAFLAHLKEHNLSRGTHLIVVPSSTLDNWDSELSKWCPSLKVEKYYGSQDERRRMRIRYAKEGLKGIDILLTTYHTVGSTPEERKMFRVIKLHYVVFDEAHMLKNMTTQRYASLITINAEMRILLTGTPLQNNLLELMSLLCFVMPSFFAKNIDDVKSLFQNKKTKSDDSSLFEEGQVEQAKRIMQPFVLRRLKRDVLTFLPKKSEIVRKIPMTDDQKEHYKELCDYYANNRGEIRGSDENAGASIMMQMRKLANHPLLMRYYFTDARLREISKQLARCKSYKTENPDHVFDDLAWLSDFKILEMCEKHGLDDVTIPDKLILNSGKFRELDTLLPKLKAEGHRALIFSQFTMMLDVIERYLDIRGHTYHRLDGQTVVTERQEMINDFNNDSDTFLFLLSTKAGGMGINLTAADTAIIHDIDFNPYNDKQAEDRCHRMGQTKPVTIYRFVTEGTIEEGMLLIANEKLKLEKEITSQEDDVKEHKCMVRLLTMALGMDEDRAEVLLTPKKGDGKRQTTKVDEF